jgi:predicted acylesterase/phospholipase RssA
MLCALLLVGCASATAIRVERSDVIGGCATTIPAQDLLLGVALSGGGSRAALFGAAGLEALARLRAADGVSVLDKISHLSSVSGGSIAATYYALKKPGHGVKVLNADGTLSEAYRAFFEQYRTDLGQDFESSLIWRQLLSFRWVNSALAAATFAEILGERLYGRTHFQDVSAREKAGDSPGLLINTTLYNNGRRLVVTSMPASEFDYDFFADLRRSLQEQGRVLDLTPRLRERWQLVRPLTPIDIHVDPCRTTLAGAVAASASFPPLIGPLTLKIGDEETYWHAGDGGLYENQGVEALILLYLKQLQLKRAKRALMIVFDSSFPFAVGERRLLSRATPFSLLTFDFSRIPSIMEERATTYQALFFQSLQIEGVIPDRQTITSIRLRHAEARWAEDLSDLPPACKTEPMPLKTPEDVRERIAEIPTRLHLPSECDRQLLSTAAAKLVDEHREEILEFVNRP